MEELALLPGVDVDDVDVSSRMQLMLKPFSSPDAPKILEPSQLSSSTSTLLIGHSTKMA